MLYITCSECSGFNPKCAKCGGGGEQPVYRCPSYYARGGGNEFMAAYRAFSDHGVLPTGGAYLEQSAEFVRMVGVVDRERAVLEREKGDG